MNSRSAIDYIYAYVHISIFRSNHADVGLVNASVSNLQFADTQSSAISK